MCVMLTWLACLDTATGEPACATPGGELGSADSCIGLLGAAVGLGALAGLSTLGLTELPAGKLLPAATSGSPGLPGGNISQPPSGAGAVGLRTTGLSSR